jgi:hypothetical protein
MLSVGGDGAEDFHLVALGTSDQGIMEVLRVEPQPEAVRRLVARIVALEPDPPDRRAQAAHPPWRAAGYRPRG